MNVATRGIRNAFRNATRTLSIVIILGLSIGLSMVMLIAHQAVDTKIATTLRSIGNTITIAPAGFVMGSDANNALTTSQLDKVQKLAHVTRLTETLRDHLQTEGTTSKPQLPPGAQAKEIGPDSSSNASTNLKSTVKLNSNGGSSGGGGMFIAGGPNGAPQLPSNFSLPVPIVGTSQPTDPTGIDATSFKITSGTAIDGGKDSNDAMISTDMASKNNLGVGSTFTAYGTTLKVAAIFDSGTQDGNSNVIVSLPTEQRLSNQKNVVTRAIATADSLTNLSSVTSDIKKALGSSADVTSNVDQANQALEPLNGVKSVSLYSLIGAVAAGAVIILLTMIMIVRERKREIGVLKAIGFSNARIMFQFMAESLTLTILGLVVGLVIGIFGGDPVTTTLVNNSNNQGQNMPMGGGTFSVHKLDGPAFSSLSDIHAHIGWSIILYGLGAAVLIALSGSALASYFISRVKPAEVLRSE